MYISQLSLGPVGEMMGMSMPKMSPGGADCALGPVFEPWATRSIAVVWMPCGVVIRRPAAGSVPGVADVAAAGAREDGQDLRAKVHRGLARARVGPRIGRPAIDLKLDDRRRPWIETRAVDGLDAGRVLRVLRREKEQAIRLIGLERRRVREAEANDAGYRIVRGGGLDDVAEQILKDERLPRDARRVEQAVERDLDRRADRDGLRQRDVLPNDMDGRPIVDGDVVEAPLVASRRGGGDEDQLSE